MVSFGKWFVWVGLVFVVLGLFLMYGHRIPFVGQLPGDIHIQRKNFSFHFPITTCILLSIVLTLVLSLLKKK